MDNGLDKFLDDDIEIKIEGFNEFTKFLSKEILSELGTLRIDSVKQSGTGWERDETGEFKAPDEIIE
jgi:hypothetical protein